MKKVQEMLSETSLSTTF